MENRIKELRLEKGITQNVLADAIGVSQQTISKYEKEAFSVPLDAMIGIADYFHTTIDYILRQTDQRYRENYRVEVNRKVEKHRELCVAYDKLTKKHRELAMNLIDGLNKEENHVPEEEEHDQNCNL
ncbi:MAG: helix-turn-helix transcriptional regulator [Hespellia sp.]|nr:helix-turn-helix transcriptional regulator [Hespellia sp.]